MITKGISFVSHLEPSTCWCPLPYISDRQALVAILVGAGGHIHRLDTPSSRVEVRGGEGMGGSGRVWEWQEVGGGGRDQASPPVIAVGVNIPGCPGQGGGPLPVRVIVPILRP